jgi:hypothetical protein
LYTQPEKTRRYFLSAPCTSSCRKAPVSFSASHGAVVSQARKRTIASPTRTAIPGFIVRLRTIPLRLLRKPMIATRSFIGVSPASLPLSTWLVFAG